MSKQYPTQEVLAIAYAAYEKNGGYLKDTFRFSEPTNETVFSNKDIVKFQLEKEFRPNDFTPLKITADHFAKVDEALKHFRRYTLGVIGDTLSDFQKDTLETLWSDSIGYSKVGILAYVPELVQRETKESNLKKLIRTEYRDSNVIGEQGESVEGVCQILHSHYSSHYERYSYTADYMGNLISFWNKFELKEGDRKRFKGKVKAHSKNRMFEVPETQLNYIKLYKV